MGEQCEFACGYTSFACCAFDLGRCSLWFACIVFLFLSVRLDVVALAVIGLDLIGLDLMHALSQVFFLAC